ncbi:MAG TPA: hemolysin family protein [Thermoflexales bacterium]|nr:hemolysin family protein [Thermoflexales bacterium]HQZ22285.1 hemolysin family protein [Thermoflexales bacterium]
MIEIILFLLALMVRAFFALARGALINLRPARLSDLEERDPGAAKSIRKLTENSGRLLATAEVGALISMLFAAAIATMKFGGQVFAWVHANTPFSMSDAWLNALAAMLVVLVIGLPLFVIGRLVPEALAVRYAEPFALATILPMQIASALMAPFVRVAVWLSNALSMPLGGRKSLTGAPATEEEIKTLVDAGEEEGLIESEEKEMIYSVLNFGDTVAREVMVPRIDMLAIEVNTPLNEALDVIIAAGHSRVPVYRETIDDVVGFLYIKDLLKVLRAPQITAYPSLNEVMRTAHFTPESKSVSDLLRELQKSKTHVCIVVDEFGGTAGMVTIEDILEEIVGEIQDELDAEEPESVALPDGGYVLDAGMAIDDVCELLKIELPEQESDTLGGLIYDQLGAEPNVGDVVHQGGATFEVLKMSERRILKVKATLAKPESASDKEEILV